MILKLCLFLIASILLFHSCSSSTEVSLQEVEVLLSNFHNDGIRYTIIQDLFSLLFMSEKELQHIQHSYKHLDRNTILRKELDTFLGGEKYEKMSTQIMGADIEVYRMQQQSSRCVPCSTLNNIVQIMCNQNYSIQPGLCVECNFLKTVISVLCLANCTTTNVTMVVDIHPKHSSKPPKIVSIQEPCVYCTAYYESIALFCGPPNCTKENYYPYYIIPGSEEKDLKISRQRSLTPFPNCIPCYYQYIAYQLLCEDLFSHCAPAPVQSPTSSITPFPSPSNTPIPSSSSAPSTSAYYPPYPPYTTSYYDDDDTTTTTTTTTTTSSDDDVIPHYY